MDGIKAVTALRGHAKHTGKAGALVMVKALHL